MRAATHVAFSQFLYLLLVSSAGLALSPLAALLAAFGSLAPDVDSGGTVAGRALPRLTRWLETRFGHRTLTHSACAVAGLALLLLPLAFFEGDLYLCLLLGYASHPVLDSMTVTGVQFFYPFSSLRCVFPMEVKHPHRYRVRTGGRTDTALAAAFLVLSVPAFLVARTGHEHAIRAVQRDIESAVREYRELEHTCTVYAQLEAKHTLSGEMFSGTLEILGAADTHTLFVLDSSGRTRSVGTRERAEFIAEQILCQKGLPISILTREVDMAGRVLGDLIAREGPHRELLFGELELEESVAGGIDPPWSIPVRRRGTGLTLTCARASDLAALGLARVIVRNGTVRILIRGHDLQHKVETPAPRSLRYELKGTSFRLLCREGDILPGDSILAVSDLHQRLLGEVAALRGRRAVLEAEHEAALAEFCRRISAGCTALKEDSAELAHLSALVDEGFASPKLLEESRRNFEAARAALRRIEAQADGQTARYRVQSKEHQAKLTETEHQATRAMLRSPGPVAVRSIRVREGRLVILLERR
jgi:membrane-bound metal-dependent hydrolase YbcI (DUF457 family)